MRRWTILVCVVAAVAAGAGVWIAQPGWIQMATGFAAQRLPSGKGPVLSNTARTTAPPVPVELVTVQRKSMPLVIDVVGTVQPIASIPIKARLDTQVMKVHVEEGAKVEKDQLLFSLDDRTLRAQQDQYLAQLEKDRAQIEQARRDAARAEELVAKGAGTGVTRDTAATVVKGLEAQTAFDQAQLANVQAQLTFTEIRAPVSGRIGSISAKAGTVVRMADLTPLATVNQMDPIFIAFGVPQSLLPELRAVMAQAETVKVQVRSDKITSDGEIAFMENTIDITTGTVLAKARMSNGSEGLWPGLFVPVRILLGVEPEAVTVPSVAVQMGQSGPYVFVVADGRAVFTPVKVARAMGDETVISSGLRGGEKIVTSGLLRIADGVAVAVPRPPGQSGTPPAPKPPGQGGTLPAPTTPGQAGTPPDAAAPKAGGGGGPKEPVAPPATPSATRG